MTKLDAPMDSGGNDAKKPGPKGQAQRGDDTLRIGSLLWGVSYLGSRPTCTAGRHASRQRWRF